MLKQTMIYLILLFSVNLYSQNSILQEYINHGLKNNLALKQREFSLKQSMYALKEAKGMFLPSIGINARYSRADGGREFEIPVGDLVNPIYSALNQLSNSNQFPTNIPNETVNFFRKEEHDTKISLVQPIFQPKVLYNYKIKSKLSDIEKIKRDIYARTLIAEIKKSYFNYLTTLEIVKLFNDTENLLRENLRVSESLFKNDKVTEDIVFRAKAELSEIIQQKSDAEKNEYLAGSYFNFLLNKPLDSKIIRITTLGNEINNIPEISEITNLAKLNREEFLQLELAIAAAGYNVDLSKSDFLPGIALAIDYGFQGEKYNFNSDNDYWMASLVLNWNLFNGFQDAAKVSMAKFRKSELETKRKEIEKQIALEVREALKNLVVAQNSFNAAAERLTSAESAFNIIERKYREGMVTQVEFLDARNTLTRAGINKIVTKYKYFINEAELERVSASHELEFE